MGFFEFATVFVLFVILPAVLLNGIKEIKKVRGGSAKAGSGQELRASELRALIADAVDEAVAPLSARVADLEERLGDESVASLRARLDPAVLADALERDPEADVPAGAARRTRA